MSTSREDLEEAVRNGDLEWVRRLVQEGVDVNLHFTYDSRTALHKAAGRSHVEIVKFLLENQANVSALDHRGATPLSYACVAYGDAIGVLQLLIDHKADIDARDQDGETSLHNALRCHCGPDRVRFLLDHKADIMAVNKEGWTALHFAMAFDSKIEVVQALIDHKAAINAADNLGRTPLHMVRPNATTAPVVAILLSHGADIQAEDEDLETPLHSLATMNCVEAVRVFLNHLLSNHGPALVESVFMCVDDEGRLPFHRANTLEMAKLLLEQPLLDGDQVVPRACHTMLLAKDGRGRSLLDRLSGNYPFYRPLYQYLSSFTNLPLTILERKPSTMPCEHRAKRPRHDVAVVPFNQKINDFQRSIATAFLNKWDQSFRRATAGAKHEDLHAMLLPDDLKYVIMSYLSTADIMNV